MPFRPQVTATVARMRRAFDALLDSLPFGTAGPRQLARELEVDAKLAWKVRRLVDQGDAFEAARHTPGPAARKRFLEACLGRGASEELIQQVRIACAEFDKLVETHAGGRASFDMLLAGQAEDEAARGELEQRRSAFRANGYLWGIQAATQLKTMIMAPCADGQRVDTVMITGFVDLQRIRPCVPWRVSSAYSVDDEGQVHDQFQHEALDPEASDPAGPPLLKDFCSSNLPAIELVNGASAHEFRLGQGPIGKTGASTILLGELIRGMEPRYPTPEYRYHGIMLRMRTPCERVLLDVHLHRDLFGPVDYTVRLFSELFSGRLLTEIPDYDELPFQGQVEKLGMGLDAVRSPEVPRYRSLIEFAHERAGWDPAEFEVHRLSIPYPITPTALILQHKLRRESAAAF